MNPEEGDLRPQLLDRFGLMVEVHDRPACALSDGAQALSCDQFDRLAGQVRELLPHACR